MLPFVGDGSADCFIEEIRIFCPHAKRTGWRNAIDPEPASIHELLNGLVAAGRRQETSRATSTGRRLGDRCRGPWHRRPPPDGEADFNDLLDLVLQWNFTLANTRNFQVEDFDLGIPNLGLDLYAPVQVKWTWAPRSASGWTSHRAPISTFRITMGMVLTFLQLELSVPGHETLDGWLHPGAEVDYIGQRRFPITPETQSSSFRSRSRNHPSWRRKSVIP